MSYVKKSGRYLAFTLFVFLSFNLYFICLMQETPTGYLLYLDLLILAAFSFFAAMDYWRFRRWEKKKQVILARGDLACESLASFENRDVAEHDVRVLNGQLRERFEENCELQDFVATWCHEQKLPLSAGLLITEQIRDVKLRGQLREQFERMKQQLNGMLLGCKLQSSLFDLQIRETPLLSCVRASIRNNQFFLIQKGAALEVQVEEVSVYTDPAWLVYILDQLLGNAVKYTGEDAKIRILGGEKDGFVALAVWDNGAGILPEDLRRVFEKGFTGSNYHNGKYRSTGLGLYMAKKIADRLGHELVAESVYGEYARFEVRFCRNDYFRF